MEVKKNWVLILVVLVTLVLGGVALMTAMKLYQSRKKTIAPTVPFPAPAAEVTPPPLIVKSMAGEGVWKQVSHDGYPGCQSASQCNLVPYSIADGWTTLNFDDSSWVTKNFTVDSNWWHNPDLGWRCKETYFTSEPETIGFIDDSNNVFPNTNGVTALYRRKFQISIPQGSRIESAELRMFSDNKTVVYINGTLTGEGLVMTNQEGCYLASVSPPLLRNGENILAIQLSNDRINEADNPFGMQYELKINFAPLSTPTPSPTPTPPPGSFTCVDLEATPAPNTKSPGERITLTCVAASEVPLNHFEFRVMIDSGQPIALPTAVPTRSGDQYRGQIDYTIPRYGCYRIECRPCVRNADSTFNCSSWGEAQ